MDFETDRDKSENGDPSLSEMTMKALSILGKNQKGYFLFVESKLRYFIWDGVFKSWLNSQKTVDQRNSAYDRSKLQLTVC